MSHLLAATHQGFFYPKAASAIASDVDPLAWFIHGITIFFTALIFALTIWFVIKYRASVHPIPEPPGHNNVLEVTWTAIPALIVFICFFWGFRVYMKMNAPRPAALTVDAIGRQWVWAFNYRNPRDGSTLTTTDMFLPVGVPVRINLSSVDVIHSLYLPALRMKKDVVPGRFNEMYVEPSQVGDYDIYCAEYCGNDHSVMVTKLHVLPPDQFDERILFEGRYDKPGLTDAQVGEAIVKGNGCISCHSVDGTRGTGPTWRDLFGAPDHQLAVGGTVKADENYILESVRNPNAKIAPGFSPPSAMSPYSPAQISDEFVTRYIVAYMKTVSKYAPQEQAAAAAASSQNSATQPSKDNPPPAPAAGAP